MSKEKPQGEKTPQKKFKIVLLEMPDNSELPGEVFSMIVHAAPSIESVFAMVRTFIGKK